MAEDIDRATLEEAINGFFYDKETLAAGIPVNAIDAFSGALWSRPGRPCSVEPLAHYWSIVAEIRSGMRCTCGNYRIVDDNNRMRIQKHETNAAIHDIYSRLQSSIEADKAIDMDKISAAIAEARKELDEMQREPGGEMRAVREYIRKYGHPINKNYRTVGATIGDDGVSRPIIEDLPSEGDAMLEFFKG